MTKLKYKLLLSLILTILILCAGCVGKDMLSVDKSKENLDSKKINEGPSIPPIANTNKAETNSTALSDNTKPTGDYEDILETGPRKKIAQDFLQQYKNYLNKLESAEGSYYELVMASDRANGLKNFHLNEETSKMLSSTVQKVKGPIKESPIFNGYSKSGVHFIALAQPVNKTNLLYKDVVNTIRENKREIELFDSVGTLSYKSETEYFAIDVLAEDLLGTKNKHTIDISVIENNSSHKPLKQPYHEGELDFIKTNYNRDLKFDNIIADKSWKLFFFDAAINQPKIIIEYEGERIELAH